MHSKLAALAALSLIAAGSAASAQTPQWVNSDGATLRSGESVEGANAAEGAWILIPIVLGTLAALIIAVTVSDNGQSDSP
jgi:hypothetical protein